jgi:hypothetical protein
MYCVLVVLSVFLLYFTYSSLMVDCGPVMLAFARLLSDFCNCLLRTHSQFSLGRGFIPVLLIPALQRRPMSVALRPPSPCLHFVSALPKSPPPPKPLFALAHIHCIAHHCTHRLLAPLCSQSVLQVQNPSVLHVQEICCPPDSRCGRFVAQARQKGLTQPLGLRI